MNLFLSAQMDVCSHLGASLEVLGGFSQSGMAHKILSILELATLLQKALCIGLGSQVRVGVLVHGAHHLLLWHVIPVDLEFGDTGLLSKDVPV